MTRILALGIAASLVVGCASSTASAPRASASVGDGGPTPTFPLTFEVTSSQARMVATLLAFLDAYNAGNVEGALRLMDPAGGISDCDYYAVRVTTADGTAAIRDWLRARAADHDQLILDGIRNDNPDPRSGSHVVAAIFGRRTSDTLRRLGFSDGITRGLGAKVVFTSGDDLIRSFANGPEGGPASLCNPAR